MLFVKALLIIIWAMLVPYLIGLLFRSKIVKNDSQNAGHALLTGYFIMFAFFYLLTMPLLLKSASLHLLVNIFAITCSVASLASIVICRKHIKNHAISVLVFLSKSSPIFLLALILILIQGSVLTLYQHIDEDDAFFVATATTAVETDTIVEFDPNTGAPLVKYHMRYVMSPFPIYTAVFSELVMMHPTIVAHNVFPAIFIPLSYLVAYLILSTFFIRQREHADYALFFLAALTIFGNVSVYTSSSFLLFRIWQGKAMLANVILPGLFLYGIHAMQRSRMNTNWIIVAFCVLAACLSSSMAVALAPFLLGVLAVVYTVRQRRFTPLIMSGLCLVPCVICGVIYLTRVVIK